MRQALTLIESRIHNGCVLIPRGMKPRYAHKVDGRWLAHVENWTPEKEYDPPFYFELYRLGTLTEVPLEFAVNGENQPQEWLRGFGEPAGEALRDDSGFIHTRERCGRLLSG
jgi:hypothetical protein